MGRYLLRSVVTYWVRNVYGFEQEELVLRVFDKEDELSIHLRN